MDGVDEEMQEGELDKDSNKLQDLERVIEEDLWTWEKPKPLEDVHRTNPWASVHMIFEVFAYSRPSYEVEDTSEDEDFGDEKVEHESKETTIE